MTRPRLPSDGCGRAEMRSHGLIQRAQALVLTGRAYSAAGQAALALHSAAVLQVFQAKMLTSEEAGLDAA